MAERDSRSNAILALLLVSPAPSIGVIAALASRDGDAAWGTVIWGASKLWFFALPAVWHVLVDRRRAGWSRPERGGFGAGAALGLLIGAVIVGGYLLVGRWAIDPAWMRAKLAPMGLTEPAVYLAGAAYWVLVNSVLEEYAYRWFIFRKCEALMAGWAAVAVAAAIFTSHHAIAMADFFDDWWVAALASAGVFIGGVVWSGLYLRYRSIWPPYLSHAIVDLAVFILGWRLLFG